MTTPKISVCMPMFNASRYLRECIDSILAQTFTDFELLIADDGSTDNSVEIVESYTDPRIRLIRRPHDYIATLNCLLDEARGEYIARMDADDVMLPNRLQLQVDYMDANPEVDVLGGGMIQFGEMMENYLEFPEYISIVELIDKCPIAHPTVIIRQKTLKSLNLHYRPAFAYAEDYDLWVRMVKEGCIIRNLKELLIKYRLSDQQITSVHSDSQSHLTDKIQFDALRWYIDKSYELLEQDQAVVTSEKDLTVIIPFLNEGDEVLNTVRSIRKTADNQVEIIVINDCSTDNRDYGKELQPFDVRYYNNKMRLGAALSKEKGVRLCSTPYFIILDAHMRCYDTTWHNTIVDTLKANPNQLLCTNSRPLHIDKQTGKIEQSCNIPPSFGAHMTFTHDRYLPFVTWSILGSVIPLLKGSEIPCIYGAGYASSCNYWHSIGGLTGLIHYGCEEQYLSIKAWMNGGGCQLLPAVYLGHIYRKLNAIPFTLIGILHIYNYLILCESLFPISIRCLGNAILWRLARRQYFQALKIVRSIGRNHIASYNQYSAHNFQFILETNNVHHPDDVILTAIKQTEKDTIRQIIQFYSSTTSSGVCNGMLAGLITLIHYQANNPNNKEIKHLINTLLKRIPSAIRTTEVTFQDGLSGIGWGLIYLISNNLISESFHKELLLIDQIISEYPLTEVITTGFFNGIGGIIAYVATRLQFSVSTNTKHNLSESLLNFFDLRITEIMNNTDDYLTYNFALQYSMRESYNESNTISPRLDDIFMPLKVIPEYIENQLRGLNGYDGLFIKYLKFQKYETKQI
ncbi:MAG: glycosyltransferase [Bacteroides sp.]|nr:glycosyltransferase [Bacteroides sp.]